MVISDEQFLLRVPVELASEADRDIVEVANRVRSNRGFDGTDGLASRSHAFEEIPLVVIADGQPDLGRIEGLLQERLGFRIESASRNGHPAVRADEENATAPVLKRRRRFGELWKFLLGVFGVDVKHLDAVGIGVLDAPGQRRIAEPVLRDDPGAFDLQRARVVGAVAPLCDIDVVNAPRTAEAAEAIVVNVHPVTRAALGARG